MKAVNKLRFNTAAEQLYADPWRGKERICRYKGRCLVCRSRLYGFDDGENDPRGPLGESHSPCSVGPDDNQQLTREHPLCFGCANVEQWYRAAIDMALDVEWKERRKGVRL